MNSHDAAETLELLATIRVVPILTLRDSSTAADIGAALVAGGIPTVEITLRTSAGAAAIERMAARGDVLVGAGTVLTRDDVDRVVDAGARYIVSPGLDQVIVERALELGVAVLPGVVTASEVQLAVRLGLSTAKFFPAEAMGGLGTISALAGPFPHFGFMPSGGITEASAPEYLRSPSVVAVSGSWMLPASAVVSHDLAAIERACRRTVSVLRGDAR